MRALLKMRAVLLLLAWIVVGVSLALPGYHYAQTAWTRPGQSPTWLVLAMLMMNAFAFNEAGRSVSAMILLFTGWCGMIGTMYLLLGPLILRLQARWPWVGRIRRGALASLGIWLAPLAQLSSGSEDRLLAGYFLVAFGYTLAFAALFPGLGSSSTKKDR